MISVFSILFFIAMSIAVILLLAFCSPNRATLRSVDAADVAAIESYMFADSEPGSYSVEIGYEFDGTPRFIIMEVSNGENTVVNICCKVDDRYYLLYGNNHSPYKKNNVERGNKYYSHSGYYDRRCPAAMIDGVLFALDTNQAFPMSQVEEDVKESRAKMRYLPKSQYKKDYFTIP